MSETLRIEMIDNARWLHPPTAEMSAGPIEQELSDSDDRVDIFTLGVARWSGAVAVRLRLADPARQAAKRRRLLEVLSRPGPLWDPARHPELTGEGGSAEWVSQIRREAEEASERRTRGGTHEDSTR
jgi:hypothetical protein